MPCILVADDNTNIQKMVALALEDRGIKVIAVGNGEAAVRRLPDLNPDLVLADVFMPVRNGYEVCEFVKRDKRFANTPVILLVGAFDPLDEKETRRVGADGVLKKPFVPPDPLIAMVISILEKNPRAAAELAAMKPKEAKDALEPHHLSALEEPAPSPVAFKAEVPLKIEPKPLPHFPEPTAEEAAMLYGFGRGRRTLDDEDADTSREPAAEINESVQEEFDGASTTSDWRRTAMDFEVPADAVNMPAFSSGDGLEPISSSAESENRAEDTFVAAVSQEEVEVASQSLEPQSVLESPVNEAEQVVEAPPVVEPEVKAEPSFASNVTHWMDLVASPQSEFPAGDWMAALNLQQNSTAPQVEEVAQPFVSEAAVEMAASERTDLPVLEQPSVIEEAVDSHEEPAFAEFPQETVASAPSLVNEETLAVPESGPVSNEDSGAADFASTDEPAQVVASRAVFSSEAYWSEPVAEAAVAHGEVPAQASESSSHQSDERIPTAPPLYREELSQIPFLVPPPGFDPDASEVAAADSDTVDAVVQRVLEKLEPQLHALLSQGVLKPLVENLLHDELAKKEK